MRDHERMIIVDADLARTSLTWVGLRRALRAVLAPDSQATAPDRFIIPVSTIAEDEEHTMLLMPSWEPESISGVKVVHHVPGNAARGLPTIHAIFVVSDATTGEALAVIDGDVLTARRTAAIAALAGSTLIRHDAQHLLVIGTGQLAPVACAAHLADHTYQSVTVWGRNADRAETTARSIRSAGDHVGVEVSDDLRRSVRAADVIVAATGSTSPVVLGADVRPGTHVSLLGSYQADMCEADAALMERSTIFVDTVAGTRMVGELAHLGPAHGGAVAAIAADLADLATRRHPGRQSDDEITVFKSAGFALADLAAARLILDVVTANASRAD